MAPETASRTLWAALTPTAAVFRIAPDRHQREVEALLDEDFQGIACSDRWWAYDYLDPQRRQVCWSHLIRDAAWDDYRQDGDRAALLKRIAPLQQELRALLEQAARKRTKTKYHRLFATNLLRRWPALWTFTTLDGVEPTNNHAERGLRGAVIYRKLSLGSQSDHGERTIERLLSASITCRLQKRSLFAYLTDALSASIRGDPIPALA